MARYFFHIYNDTITIDREGQELVDFDAAKAEATRGARDLMCASIRKGELVLSHRIDVEGEGGQPLLSVRFSDAVSVQP